MRRLALFVIALAAAATSALAAPPRALLYTEPGHPRAAIPGHNPGLEIDFFSVGKLAYSPNGRRWVATGIARNGVNGTRPTVVLSGDDRGIRQAVVANVPMPGSGLAFFLNPGSLAINNAGDFAFSSAIVGASTLDRVFVARCRGATGLCEVAARQNQVIPGLANVIPAAAGERYGSSLTVVGVLPDGRVAMLAESTSGPLASGTDELLLIEGDPVQVLAQAGATVPPGQAGGGAEALANLDRRLGIDGNGRRWIIGGQLNGTGNPYVVVRNGRVVLQEDVPVPGLLGSVTTQAVSMNGTGRWIVRGTSDLGQRFLIVDGVVRLSNGMTVPGHPSRGVVERIDGAAVNARGDLAYAITTSTNEWLLMVERVGGPPTIVLDGESPLDLGIAGRPPVTYSGMLDAASKPMYFAGDRLYFMTRARRSVVSVPTGDGLFVLTLPSPPAPTAGTGR